MSLIAPNTNGSNCTEPDEGIQVWFNSFYKILLSFVQAKDQEFTHNQLETSRKQKSDLSKKNMKFKKYPY
jgi:hypothetical protein